MFLAGFLKTGFLACSFLSCISVCILCKTCSTGISYFFFACVPKPSSHYSQAFSLLNNIKL